MTVEDTRSGVGVGQVPTTAELIDRLSQFEGPPELFLANLLAVQCHIALAGAGAILRVSPEGKAEVLAAHPRLEPGATAPVWLAQAAESTGGAVQAGKTITQPIHESDSLYGQPARRHLVVIPLARGGAVRGAAAFVLEAGTQADLAAGRDRLELSMSLLSLYEMRLTLQQRGSNLIRLRASMETLSAVNEAGRFAGAAMALCNEVASRWQCERVTLGFLAGRYVKLKAMSHTEKFSRKMRLVQDIESVMEECLDQDLEVLHPSAAQATYVSRVAADLARRHGPAAVASVPLRRAGHVVAVLTAERLAESPFGAEEMEALRLTCDLCTPRLADLHEHDRWFGARAAAGVRKGFAALLGPRHTWAKVAGLAVVAVLAVLIFGKGEWRADAPFVLEPVERQVVPAPFDGYLKAVHVEPGDQVVAEKTVLAELDDAELKLELARAEADRDGYLKQAAVAMRDRKTTDAQVAQAEADKAAATIRLLEYRIKKARITSGISGVVLAEDLKKQIGAPVKTGQVLFEVAPLETLRAELAVPENQIADVQLALARVLVNNGRLKGELATANFPDVHIGFEVQRINPMAELVDQKNVFKVRARLEGVGPAWMRPGMEGVAKISLGRKRYGWLLTRRIVNWVRMKLWL